jgi:hypothetical protein
MGNPVSYVQIKALPSFDDLFDPFGNVGMAQDNDPESLQKFPVGKGVKGLDQRSGVTSAIDLVTLMTHLERDSTAPLRADPLNEMIHRPVLDDPSEKPIFPLFRIRQVSVGHKGSPPSQALFTPVRVNLHFHSKPVFKERGEKKIMIPFEVLDMNSLIGKPLETSKHRKVVRKGKRLLEV